MEGSRPILVELQALVTPSNLGTPRRMAKGVDSNRISLLIAVLEKIVGLYIQTQDVFINVVSGVKIDEPAVDLALCLAMTSSFRNLPLDHKTVVFGEVGLSGEIRTVPYVEQRIREAEKLGFTRCILPEHTRKRLTTPFSIATLGVMTVADAIEAALNL